MTEFLLNKFVKNNDDVKNSEVREKVGTLSSFTGIFCNILLFALKFVMGTISNSVAVISDAFNNLSDCLSCIITFASYKLAAKPADKDHPFGHGRIEYLSSIVIAVIIALVGFEFLKTSVDKIIHPEKVIFKVVTVASLVASVLVKLWMSAFNKKLGTKYNSLSMIATSQDSLSDSITTSVTLIGIFASLFTDLPVDGIIGCLVSVLILKAAYGIIKDTVDVLLGQPADEETVQSIMEIVNSRDEVLGVHDLIVHNYGPGKIMCSLHAEVDSQADIMETHEVIDDIELELYEKLHIMTTIHMDPLDTKNEQLNEYRQKVKEILNEIEPELSMHDFRMVPGEGHTNLIFDIVINDHYRNKTSQLKNELDTKLNQYNDKLRTVINFDTQF